MPHRRFFTQPPGAVFPPGGGAPMHNQINNGRFAMALGRIFQMVGGNSPAPTLSPEVQPVMNVNDQELSLLAARQVKMCFAWCAAPAVAGQFASMELRNPNNSGMLVVVRRVQVISQGSQSELRISRGTVGVAGTGTNSKSVTETRYFNGIALAATDLLPQATFGSGSVAVYPADTRIVQMFPLAGLNMVDVNVVLAPGWSVALMQQAANTLQNAQIEWTERALTQQETVVG